MKARFFLLITALCLTAGFASAQDQEYTPTPVTVSRSMIRMNGKLYYSHVVLERQTLYSISKAYNVSIDDIYAANPSLHQTGLRKNAILMIPSTGTLGAATAEAAIAQSTRAQAPAAETSKAEAPKAEAPVTQAPQPQTPQPQAAQTDIPQTQTTAQPETEAQPQKAPAVGATREHTVRWYDTLYGISRKYGVSIAALMAANGLTTSHIVTGQVLIIPEPEITESPDTTGVAPKPADTVRYIFQDIKDEITEQIEDMFSSPKDNVDATLLLPFNASGSPSEMNMDFYAGVLMAVRDLEASGIHTQLHVYDVATGVIPSQDRLAASDFVLGPVSASDLETVLKRTDGLVPVISPLDQKAAEHLPAYPKFIQAPSTPDAQYTDLAEWLAAERTREDQVIVITEQGMENNAASAIVNALTQLGETYSSFSYSLREGTGVPTRIAPILVKGRTNRIVVASDRQQFLSDVLRNVNIMLSKGYEIILYAPSKIRTFDFDVNLLHKAQLHISSAYHVDYDDPQVKRFLLAYRALYNTEPTQFAFQGYDTFYYFARLVAHNGDHWLRHLETGTEKGLHTGFRFRERQNEASLRVVYGKDSVTRRAR